MTVVGICGSTGSGKSSVCKFFSRLGFPVLDCDKIYHNLVNKPSECQDEICRTFGQALSQNGKLDRKALRKIVFSDAEKLTKLNKISHRYVLLEIEKEIQFLKDNGAEFCFIDAPMLFESGLDKRCEYICAVISDPEIQIQRVLERDQISREDAINRLENQIPVEILQKNADFIIQNNGNFEEIEKQCDLLLNKIHK